VTIAACIVAWHLHRVLGALFAKTTSRTANRVDDILLSFVLTALRIGIIVAGALGIAWFLGIPARGMLAGLGISGLAFALASRDTLANLFGAGILLIDRPFKKGDWIQTDKIEGSVEEVGVRSTRVRTAEDSLVVVPNGKLADSIINNLGTRRQRLVRMQLLITGGGTPENINAFTSAVRSRMAEDKEFSERKLEVSVTSIGKSGIEVELHGYLNVTNSRDETAARHQLLLDVMTLAQSAGLILGEGIAKPVPPS
jgi:MscS family membrane protein